MQRQVQTALLVQALMLLFFSSMHVDPPMTSIGKYIFLLEYELLDKLQIPSSIIQHHKIPETKTKKVNLIEFHFYFNDHNPYLKKKTLKYVLRKHTHPGDVNILKSQI